MGSEAARLEVDLGAVVGNWLTLRAGAAGRGPRPGPLPQAREGDVAAVLKADGYGLGAGPVASALFGAGCRAFFVAHLEEALAIRDRMPGAMLAVLNGLWPGTEGEFVAAGVRPVLGSLAEVAVWAARARTEGRALPALLHVDTGMNRLGLSAAEVGVLAGEPGRLEGIRVEYVMTHLVSAEEPDDPMNLVQRERFAAACLRLPPARRSFANSSGMFLGAGFASDLARPGAALYGVNPTPGRPNPMRGVVRLTARILQLREVPPGETVGYNGQWAAARTSRIATVSVGYADGFLRSLSNRAVACFDGMAVPLVGRVSMDLTTFDVTDAPAAVVGSWIELIGPGNPVDAVAARAGTNGYEVLTSLGRRYARTYLPA